MKQYLLLFNFTALPCHVCGKRKESSEQKADYHHDYDIVLESDIITSENANFRHHRERGGFGFW